MPFFKSSLSGPGYIVLNIIRACNIICLLAVVAASMCMLFKTFIVSKFFFFDGVSHVITASLAMALILTEINVFKRYLANNWPLLSINSGFITLAILMIILGVSILGNLNKTATSEKSLGSTFWQLTIASGILVLIFGVINIFANYAFRHKSLGITARQVRQYGSTAPQKVDVSPSMSVRTAKSGRRSFHLGARRSVSDTLPSYNTNNHPAGRNISAPVMATSPTKGGSDGGVPIVNGVARPDLAHHPAYHGQSF
ncbi:hypothetical protein N7G274_006121 [Stereocaulon virgatum]|uniref:DUF7598 domain-containing protein n=1 Tax=Stereocaulon virgatum TaxID=373712 RepID=A0ABR4A9Q5_9LECA